jgi:hypothetical protein
MVRKTLGKLMHIANSNPPAAYRELFYKIKKPILQRFGVYLGTQAQQFKYTCWSCYGTGIWEDFESHRKDTCFKCNGSGVYRHFWWILDVYQLGEHTFHIPKEKVERFPTNMNFAMIEGKITHKEYRERDSWQAFLTLIYLCRRCIRLDNWKSEGDLWTRNALIIEEKRTEIPF